MQRNTCRQELVEYNMHHGDYQRLTARCPLLTGRNTMPALPTIRPRRPIDVQIHVTPEGNARRSTLPQMRIDGTSASWSHEEGEKATSIVRTRNRKDPVADECYFIDVGLGIHYATDSDYAMNAPIASRAASYNINLLKFYPSRQRAFTVVAG